MKLEIKNTSVTYPVKNQQDVQALKDINISIKENEFVVAIGESGCGKTTILNLIAGFIRPTTGKILLDSKPILKPNFDRGVVFQKHALMPWLNVLDNAILGLKFRKTPIDERIKIGLENLELVGLKDFAYKQIYELSGGMQQRVGIARAVSSNPKMLLMDEPLGALDQFTRETIQELILQIWKKTQKLIFFITHSVEEALFMATRLLVFSPRPGRIVEDLPFDFCHRYLECRDARKVKSSRSFIQAREKILKLIIDTKLQDQSG